MGSIVSCATRNEVKQQTYEQRRMHAAYAEYFSKLEQGLKGELPFQVVARLLTDDDEAVAASEEESERQERELERALQCALLVLLLTLDALHRMSANAERTRLESALGNSDVAAAAAHSGVPRGCERWMAFERAHSASLSRLDFATLAERSKALYFAKVNDFRISHPRLELKLITMSLRLKLQQDDDSLERDGSAPTSIVDRLPCRTSAGGPDEDEKECAVCLSQFKKGDLVRMLPCRHEFHADCIDKWLLEKDRRCPCCRVDVCAAAPPDHLPRSVVSVSV